MSPFSHSQIAAKPSLRRRLAARPALTVFLLCLVLGLAAVAWRAKARTDTARAHARTEALALGVAVELQFSRALTAAEVLGALVRQSSGAISNFQKVAGELLAGRPGLAYLELQPGGVVSDIVPLAGYERAIGFNVLKDPAHHLGASAAIQRRVLTVAGPLKLYHGEPGLVARVPVFQRGRDGRDYFWGFVAVSMRLPEALARAHVDELSAQGYSYAFFTASSTQQKAVTIAARGGSSFQNAVEQPVWAQNLEFRLAVQPRGGWVNKTKVTLDCLGVLLVSGLLCLLINVLERGREGEAGAADANRRLARDTADRQADLTFAESQVRLEAMVRGANEASEADQVRLRQAELRAT